MSVLIVKDHEASDDQLKEIGTLWLETSFQVIRIKMRGKHSPQSQRNIKAESIKWAHFILIKLQSAVKV